MRNLRNRKVLIVGGSVLALAAGGAGIALGAGGGDDSSGQPITGNALDTAKAVSLDHTGGGQVIATEVRDEEGYYEVEVKKSDGSQVDVHLDRGFNIIDSSGDGSGGDDAGSE
ncbi:MAG: hypothetical protein AABM42_00620 [Actinomycetota bacterium]